MLTYFNGIPFVGIGQDGETVLPFTTFINFVGATVTRGTGENANSVNVDVGGGGGGGAPNATILRLNSDFAADLAEVVPWETAERDDAGLFNIGSPTLLTIPAALDGATVIFSAGFQGTGMTAGARAGCAIVSDAIVIAELTFGAYTGGAGSGGCQTPPLTVAEGETYLMQVYGDAAWTLEANPITHFTAIYWPLAS